MGNEESKTMPEKIILEDGTEREVLTDDEVKNFKAGHDANAEKRPIVEQFNKAVESLELKEGQTMEQRLVELKDAENPNWKKMRDTMKVLKDVAKEKNIDIDDDGNIVEKKEGLTAEDAAKIAEDTVLKARKNQQKTEALSKFSKDDAVTVSEVFDKLDSVGGSFESNMQLAIEKTLPGQSYDPLKQAINSPGGSQPNIPKGGDLSPELKDFGSKFGLTEDDYKKS
jgi:hypothetical protein